MNDILGGFLTGFLGLLFSLLFFGLVLVFMGTGRKRAGRFLRDIPAYTRLRRAVGLAVEAGTRLHISLGRGGLLGSPAGSTLVGLTILDRIARAASISDRPPVATSGESLTAVLSQDTLRNAYQVVGAENQYNPIAGRLSGLTPLSYAAGALSVIYDEQVSANIITGHLGSEIALLTDASEHHHNLTVAGTDDLPGQSVLYATIQDPLIGEELFAAGAYLGSGSIYLACLRAQDVMRWILIAVMVFGTFARLVGLW